MLALTHIEPKPIDFTGVLATVPFSLSLSIPPLPFLSLPSEC